MHNIAGGDPAPKKHAQTKDAQAVGSEHNFSTFALVTVIGVMTVTALIVVAMSASGAVADLATVLSALGGVLLATAAMLRAAHRWNRP